MTGEGKIKDDEFRVSGKLASISECVHITERVLIHILYSSFPGLEGQQEDPKAYGPRRK